jgi:uncharacterized protein GlcG (DUF336 family)
MKTRRVLFTLISAVTLLTTLFALPAFSLPTYSQLRTALKAAVAEGNGGFGFNVWATIVDRWGVVQVIAFSGKTSGDQWPASRVISVQKAYTASVFSLPSFALSTANLYSAVQPGGSLSDLQLFGMQFSNPVNATVALQGQPTNIGTASDPVLSQKIGGLNVGGGGLALYDNTGTLVGGIGVSGDSSCAAHNIAWKVRHTLGFDYIPGGVSPTKDDNIIYDIVKGVSASGWGHPECSGDATQIGEGLPVNYPIRTIP